jgi:hypothetical protein
MALTIKRWDGTHLVHVPDPDLPTYARAGLYVMTTKHGANAIWRYAGPDPIPDTATIKTTIINEVPNVKT